MAIFGTLGEADLSAVSASISDTAVDVFVYDTTKDSDGGAWRKRTQNTSWYNETLGTATRGSRKEFPAVAVIVAESDKVTIYDGDDPDLPMWMVLNADSSDPTKYAIVRSVGKTISSLYALNGIICDPVSYNGLFYQNFVGDACYRVNTTNTIFGGSIVNRNGGMNFALNVTSSGIVNTTVNDVAMTVLPNAPIDSATGLPIPTIAVATDGGPSVIKDDGSIVDWIETSGPDSAHKVSFRKDNKLGVFTSGTAGATGYPQLFYIDIPSSDISSAFYYDFNGNNIERFGGTAWETNSDRNLVMKSPASNPLVHNLTDVVDTPNLTYAATNGGLNAIIRPEAMTSGTSREDMRTAAIAYIQNDYNTGYMHGDIKGAFLSDTTDIELVTNGTFDSNTDGWTSYHSVISVDSNRLRVDDTAGVGGWSAAVYEVATVIGKTYQFTFTYTFSSDTFIAGHYAGSYASAGVGTAPTSYTDYGTTSGTYIRFITATSTTTSLVFAVNNNGVSFLDNVSFKLAEADRSVNNNPLQVFGTITKSAVATGADLVAYSGFSASNYLEQPYNSSMDIFKDTSSTFSITGWIKRNSTNTGDVFFSTGRPGFTGEARSLALQNNGTLYFYGWNSSYDSGTTAVTAADSWTHFHFSYVNGLHTWYVNGVLDSTHNKPLVTYTENMPIKIGDVITTTGQASRPVNDSLSLLRISGSVPSPEQIKKMYEDEKVLFQENAKATLYGSSDAVTALAYDDTTELLHVGTSAGRSEFQGLRRINNTTDPVTTAISAHDSLIIEQ